MSSIKNQKKWSVGRAALYGLIFGIGVNAIDVLATNTGYLPSPNDHIFYWIGRLIPMPALFVLVALINNFFAKRSN
jgi:hypothetical protein